MTTLTLEQPAPALPALAERPAIADALRAAPGRWALLGQHASLRALQQATFALRKGTSGWQAFGDGFETSVAKLGDEHRLYVRYVEADRA